MGTEDNRAPLRDHRLYVVFGITLMGVMGVSSITPASPPISRALGLSSRQVGLLLTVFTVPGVFLAPVLGFLSDRFGRKRIVIPALMHATVAKGQRPVRHLAKPGRAGYLSGHVYRHHHRHGACGRA